MKKYINPSVDLIICATEDVISTSSLLGELTSGVDMQGSFSDLLTK